VTIATPWFAVHLELVVVAIAAVLVILGAASTASLIARMRNQRR